MPRKSAAAKRKTELLRAESHMTSVQKNIQNKVDPVQNQLNIERGAPPPLDQSIDPTLPIFFSYNDKAVPCLSPDHRTVFSIPSSFFPKGHIGSRKGQAFHSVEHFLFFWKADFFDEESVALQIRDTTDRDYMQELAANLTMANYDDWKPQEELAVDAALRSKFMDYRNGRLAEKLIETGDRPLILLAPENGSLGIGLSLEEALPKRKPWGANVYGKALMKLRDELKHDPMIKHAIEMAKKPGPIW